MFNSDVFASQFFARGAIKATLLTVDGNPNQTELKKLETWWRRFFSGVSGAWETAAIRAGIQAIPVGEGLDSLSSETLTNSKREDIATAMGVPHSLVLSNAANYATAKTDEQGFYSRCVIPDALLIQRQLNRQIFEPMGLRFKFDPQELPCFQADENERAVALKSYVDAGMKLSIAAEMLGLYLPAGVEYADLDPDPELEPAPPPATAPPPPTDDAAAVEAAQFKRWLKKKPGRDASKFEHHHLTAEDMRQIIAETSGAQGSDTPDPFRADADGRTWEGYP